ncbi:transporter [Neomegalonema perideroedes]|uniref:transporter n=1 Tax=Neomegalonema perideroedes TaxID=217219 RepID=UPI000366072B|nr:transporter [Neomegalonema perideroedes]
MLIWRLRTKIHALTSALVGALAASPAAAIDIMPGDYTVLPSGTNAALLYGQYATAGKLHVEGAGEIPDSKLETAVGIARLLHYSDIGGVPVAGQAILPFGGLTEARIGGADLERENGVGDVTFGATVWPLNRPGPYGTTLGVTLYVAFPSGDHSGAPGSLSLGSGSINVTPQVGLIQNLGGSFFLDAAADMTFREDHDDFGLKHSRDPSTQVQTYLRYQISPATSVSVGYSGLFGGEDHVDGVYQGTKTRSDQLRLFGATMLSPSLQVQGMIGTDLQAKGGFEQDVVATLRVMKLF